MQRACFGCIVWDAAHPCDTKRTLAFTGSWSENGADHMFDHNWKIKYPGVAYRLGTWFGTKVRLVRLQSLGPSQKPTLDAVGGNPTASVVSGFLDPLIFTSGKKDVNSDFRPSHWIRTSRIAFSKRAPRFYHSELVGNDKWIYQSPCDTLAGTPPQIRKRR